MKVAIKLMAKHTINRIFSDNGQPFSELDIMLECSKAQCSNIIELIEGFEDPQYLYIVTKFVPAGDLLNYLVKQAIQPLPESHAKKIMLQIC
jgi:serine/threonine protein kinase